MAEISTRVESLPAGKPESAQIHQLHAEAMQAQQSNADLCKLLPKVSDEDVHQVLSNPDRFATLYKQNVNSLSKDGAVLPQDIVHALFDPKVTDGARLLATTLDTAGYYTLANLDQKPHTGITLSDVDAFGRFMKEPRSEGVKRLLPAWDFARYADDASEAAAKSHVGIVVGYAAAAVGIDVYEATHSPLAGVAAGAGTTIGLVAAGLMGYSLYDRYCDHRKAERKYDRIKENMDNLLNSAHVRDLCKPATAHH